MGRIKVLLEFLKDQLVRRLPDCKTMTPTIGESLDRELGLWEKFMLKLHLFTCDRCSRYLEHLGLLKTAFRDHGEKIADPKAETSTEFTATARSRIKEALSRSVLSTF